MRRFFLTGEPTKEVGVSHEDGCRCNAEIVGERRGGGDEISFLSPMGCNMDRFSLGVLGGVLLCGDIRFVAFAAFSEIATETSSRSINVATTGVFGVTDSNEISSITFTFGIHTALGTDHRVKRDIYYFGTRDV